MKKLKRNHPPLKLKNSSIAILIALIIMSVLYVLTVPIAPASNIKDELFCEKNDDCTEYNSDNCCGWKPINKAMLSSKNHQEQVCLMMCAKTKPTCINNQCALVPTD